jgi:hypothetical protein
MQRIVVVTILSGFVAGCEPLPEPARTISAGHMPSGAACHVGSPDLSLKVTVDEVTGGPVGFEPGSAESTDLTLGFVGNTASTRKTTVRLANRSKRPLKVDLWRSQNGERYDYTSSCPIAPGRRSFETWDGDVPWVYVSNPRFLSPDSPATCE